MQRLGQNHGSYFGERIDIAGVLRDIKEAAEQHGWALETLSSSQDIERPALRRGAADAPRRLYVSTGIHGDEPAGPLAILQLLRDNAWPADASYWLCPCLNPTGFPLNRRENAEGVDLNRDYLHLQTPEVRSHVAWLERQPAFDVTVCLHEDWESHGFYLYELNPDDRPSHAGEVIRRVAEICPIDPSPIIETRPAQGGIIRPAMDPALRPQWPEAFWLITHKTRHSYTLEAPSDFSLATRVAALVTATKAILEGPVR